MGKTTTTYSAQIIVPVDSTGKNFSSGRRSTAREAIEATLVAARVGKWPRDHRQVTIAKLQGNNIVATKTYSTLMCRAILQDCPGSFEEM